MKRLLVLGLLMACSASNSKHLKLEVPASYPYFLEAYGDTLDAADQLAYRVIQLYCSSGSFVVQNKTSALRDGQFVVMVKFQCTNNGKKTTEFNLINF